MLVGVNMFGKSEIPETQPSLNDKYIDAFKDIITPDILIEVDDQKVGSRVTAFVRETLPANAIRRFSDTLSLPQKHELLKIIIKDPSEESKSGHKILNYKTFFLFDGDKHLNWHDRIHKSVDLFPSGKENKWPIVIITSNSNLISPQVFFDSYEAAKKLVPVLTDVPKNNNMLVIGTYFSKDDAFANARDTLGRISDLKKDQDDISRALSATSVQVGQLLNFLVERYDEGEVKGNVKEHLGKPVLRSDADKIMKHIIGYGYSGGHLTNKDTFRTLRHFLDDGRVMIRDKNNDTGFRQSGKADSQKIFPGVRLIGIAGADGFEEQGRGMPKEVNFVSDKDKIIAFHGRKFMKGSDIIKINVPSDKEIREKYISDHDQNLYINALLDGSNKEAINSARQMLSHKTLSI